MVNFSMMTFLFFIVLPIGLCVLEIFLSRMDNKYIGLILPAITFIYSLIALLSFAIFDGATTGEIVVSMLTTSSICHLCGKAINSRPRQGGEGESM